MRWSYGRAFAIAIPISLVILFLWHYSSTSDRKETSYLLSVESESRELNKTSQALRELIIQQSKELAQNEEELMKQKKLVLKKEEELAAIAEELRNTLNDPLRVDILQQQLEQERQATLNISKTLDQCRIELEDVHDELKRKKEEIELEEIRILKPTLELEMDIETRSCKKSMILMREAEQRAIQRSIRMKEDKSAGIVLSLKISNGTQTLSNLNSLITTAFGLKTRWPLVPIALFTDAAGYNALQQRTKDDLKLFDIVVNLENIQQSVRNYSEGFHLEKLGVDNLADLIQGEFTNATRSTTPSKSLLKTSAMLLAPFRRVLYLEEPLDWTQTDITDIFSMLSEFDLLLWGSQERIRDNSTVPKLFQTFRTVPLGLTKSVKTMFMLFRWKGKQQQLEVRPEGCADKCSKQILRETIWQIVQETYGTKDRLSFHNLP